MLKSIYVKAVTLLLETQKVVIDIRVLIDLRCGANLNESEGCKDISLRASLLLRVYITLFFVDSVQSLQHLVYIWLDSNDCHINWKSNVKNQ